MQSLIFPTGNLLLAKVVENHASFPWVLPFPFWFRIHLVELQFLSTYRMDPVLLTHVLPSSIQRIGEDRLVQYTLLQSLSSLKPARSVKWTSVVSHQALHLLLICTNQYSSLVLIWRALLWYLRTKIIENRYRFYQKTEFCIVVEAEESY